MEQFLTTNPALQKTLIEKFQYEESYTKADTMNNPRIVNQKRKKSTITR